MPRKNALSTEEPGTEARFLDGISLRPVSLPTGVPFTAVGLALGQGTSPLELLVTTSAAPPNATTLRSAWKARNAGRAAPLLLVVLHAERASLCGPDVNATWGKPLMDLESNFREWKRRVS